MQTEPRRLSDRPRHPHTHLFQSENTTVGKGTPTRHENWDVSVERLARDIERLVREGVRPVTGSGDAIDAVAIDAFPDSAASSAPP